MSRSVNQVILLGNLGADPVIRTLDDGRRVANLSMATSEKFTDKETGEVKEQKHWHKVVTFNQGLIQVIEEYLHNGSRLMVTGKLQYRCCVPSPMAEFKAARSSSLAE